MHTLGTRYKSREDTHRFKTQTPVFIDFPLKLTFFKKVNSKIFGSRVRALQLQVAPREQAALDGPEQGEEHRVNLPLGPIEHQQLTLQGRRQTESVHNKAIHSQGHSLRQQLSLAKKTSREMGNSQERAFNPEVTKKDGVMKAPLLLSAFRNLYLWFSLHMSRPSAPQEP